MFDVAPAFPNNPKEDGEIKEADTSPFKIKESVADVLDLSFCPWKSIDEVSNLFLSLCLGRLWFSNEVDDLKEAQYSEEVRQVVQLVFVGGHLRGLEIVCHCITQAIKRKSPSTVSCDAFQISIHSFKEPLPVSLFPSQTDDCPSEFVSLVVQAGRWEKEDADTEIKRGTSMSTTWSKPVALVVAPPQFLLLSVWFV